MAEVPDVSVVIGFKDWGLTRLRLAVSTITESFGELTGEVVVSDYGSKETSSTRAALEGLGATYVYTATDGTWSRSRALNAGFANSRGRVLVSTDADMIFSPRSMEVIGKRVLEDPRSAILLQCRDLPSQWSDASVAEKGTHWLDFERVARRRPRWGMGGMVAVSREMFLTVRGYDERMQTYGGEDIDFATRIRRAGARLIWIEDPAVRMYHMWHPSTAETHTRSAADSAHVAANKRIMREDKTFVRNVVNWSHRPKDARPLVSVVIATYNRADLILDSIHSIQAQTVQDFEIVVIDDGSTDNTYEVVNGLDDPRIRYFRQENAGVAAARNRGIDESLGQYVAVMDDDDIALPWRLEAHFDALTEGVNATFGSFVNFDNATGELKLHRTKLFTDEVTSDKGGAPGHSTWMVDRDLMRAIRYDAQLASGIDNNFALRSLRSGLEWRHTGRVHSLRRMHDTQITSQGAAGQSAAARDSYAYFTFLTSEKSLSRMRKERGRHDYVPLTGAEEADLRPFLPDHLVVRSMIAENQGASRESDILCVYPGGRARSFSGAVGVTWSDLADLRGRVSEAFIAASPSHAAAQDHALARPVNVVLALLRAEALEAQPLGEGQVAIEVMASAEGRRGEDSWTNRKVRITTGAEASVWQHGLASVNASLPELLDKLSSGSGGVRVSGSPAAIDRLTKLLLGQGVGEAQ